MYSDAEAIKERGFILRISGEPITEKDLKRGAFYISGPPKRIIDTIKEIHGPDVRQLPQGVLRT